MMMNISNKLLLLLGLGLLAWLIFHINSCSNKLMILPKVGTTYEISGCETCAAFTVGNTEYAGNPFFTTKIKVVEIRDYYIKYQCLKNPKEYYILHVYRFNDYLNSYK